MRDYKSGKWGFSLVCGLNASVFPRALALAFPNALVAFLLGLYIENNFEIDDSGKDDAKNAFTVWGGFTSVLFFILYFRSNVAYDRWWEGGTLLQQTRGEWFNAYSSLIAFSSTDPKMQNEVEKFHHLLARLMSLLFSCALQQVSPDKERPLEIIDPTGIDPQSLMFLKESSDKVEVILQWIQRCTIINMDAKVLPIAPPVMSRAFQEVSRGIVNLQNARKIADFPFPFPFAQTSIVMLLIHWAACPIVTCYLTDKYLASITCFSVVFFLWCINYIALQLEQPFGSDANDLPINVMQSDWNKSVGTLLAKRAQSPPKFDFDSHRDQKLEIIMSDGTITTRRRLTIPAGAITDDGNRSSAVQRVDSEKSNSVGKELPRTSVASVAGLGMQSNRHRLSGNDENGPNRDDLDGADGPVAPDRSAAIPDGGGVAANNTGMKSPGIFSALGNIFNFTTTRGHEKQGANQYGLEDGFEDAEEALETLPEEEEVSGNSSSIDVGKSEVAEAPTVQSLAGRRHVQIRREFVSEEAPDGALATVPRSVPMHNPVGSDEAVAGSPVTDGVPQALPSTHLSRDSVTNRSSPGSPGSRHRGLNAGLTPVHVQVDIPDHAPGRPPPESGPPDHAPGRPQSDSRQNQENHMSVSTDDRSNERQSPEESHAVSAVPAAHPGAPVQGGSAVTSTSWPHAAV